MAKSYKRYHDALDKMISGLEREAIDAYDEPYPKLCDTHIKRAANFIRTARGYFDKDKPEAALDSVRLHIVAMNTFFRCRVQQAKRGGWVDKGGKVLRGIPEHWVRAGSEVFE